METKKKKNWILSEDRFYNKKKKSQGNKSIYEVIIEVIEGVSTKLSSQANTNTIDAMVRL